MRKLLWCGVAAAVFGAWGTGYLAWKHPESLLGRCLHRADEVRQRCNPIQLATHVVAAGGGQAQTTAESVSAKKEVAQEEQGGDEACEPRPEPMLAAVLNWQPAEPAAPP